MPGIQLIQTGGATVNAGGVSQPPVSTLVAAVAPCALSVVGRTPTSYVWGFTPPPNSKAALNVSLGIVLAAALGANPSFTPDIPGTYTITCVDDTTTQYVLYLNVSPSSLTVFPGAVQLAYGPPASVQTPQVGSVLFSDSSNSGAFSYKDPNNLVGLVRGAVAGLLDPALGITTDVNSLICGDITIADWVGQPTNIYVFPNRAATSGGYLDAHLLNANGAAGGNGEIFHHFTLPAGVTSCTFNVPATSSTSTTTIKLIIRIDSGANKATQVFTITTTEQVLSLTATGLTPGTLYDAVIQTNDTGQQARPYIGKCSLVPIGGTGTFASSFVRFRASPGAMGGTAHRAVWNTLFYELDSHAEISFITNTGSIASEVYGFNTGGVGTVAYLERGRIRGTNTVAAVNGAITIDDFAFAPSATAFAERPVSVRQFGGAGGFNGTNRIGVFLRAVYLPLLSSIGFTPLTTPKKLIILGDSIAAANVATNLLWQGWNSRIRLEYPGTVILDAYASREFRTEGASTAAQKAWAQFLAQSHPTDLWIALGVNDYVQAVWSAASFGTAYTAFLDFFHTACPQCRVWCQSPIAKSVETANAQGSTLQNYRDQIQTAATDATRTHFCYFDSGLGGFYPGVSSLSGDGIHPTTDGHGLYAQAVRKKMRDNGAM